MNIELILTVSCLVTKVPIAIFGVPNCPLFPNSRPQSKNRNQTVSYKIYYIYKISQKITKYLLLLSFPFTHFRLRMKRSIRKFKYLQLIVQNRNTIFSLLNEFWMFRLALLAFRMSTDVIVTWISNQHLHTACTLNNG